MGRLAGVFGIRGELKCRPVPGQTDAIASGRRYALGAGPDARELRCTGMRRHHERLLLAFDGIDTPESARALVGLDLYAESGDTVLGPGEYLDADLIGLRLIAEDGSELARVVAVRHYPAQDCLVVDPGQALVPLVKAFVRAIDVAGGAIHVSLPRGLLTDDSELA